jgi:hypothetical protein
MTIEIRSASKRIAELTVTNASPDITFTTSKDHRSHAFGSTLRPRFRMEQPYSPDDEWSLVVDPSGALVADIPVRARSIDMGLDGFFERPIDDLSRRLLYGLPSGRYVIVRSPRTPEMTRDVLLGNVFVPAAPNVRVLCDMRPFYAAVFGADAKVPPSTSALLLGVTVLSYNGQGTLDGIWLFDLHGPAAPVAPFGEIAAVLPLDGPLVIDALDEFRNDGGRKPRERWLNERGPTFARWLAGNG